MPALSSEPETLWQQQVQLVISEHFEAARQRVDSFSREHLTGLGTVIRRHWQCRGDIPRDLANLPLSVWRLANRAAGRHVESTSLPSRKAQQLAALIQHDLLQLAQLEHRLVRLLQQHPEFDRAQFQALQAELSQYSPHQASERVHLAIDRLRLTHEGGRDAMLFFSLGMLSKGLGDKIAFGSAAGIGASVAGGIYLGQQSALGALWAQWFGLPGWVAVSGAAGGVLSMVLLTPLISPLFEAGISRVRGQKILHQLIDQAQHRVAGDVHDAGSLTGMAGTYLQMLPDLVQALRALK